MPEALAEHEAGGTPPPSAPDAAPPTRPEMTDVWSWTERKYRIRATVLLLVNLVLFCGLCVFTHWLHVGRAFQFTVESYVRPFRFWGPQTQNLYDFLRYPVSVEQTPMYGVVIGLLVASIVAVPISVAIVYRLRCAVPFCAAVAIFAHMPWMALTLAGSCILASVPPFRMKFRYGSALLGLVPVLFYLLLATRGPTEEQSATISPEQMLLQIGPWLLAILAACLMLAIVIFMARVVNYRPGPIAPVMAVMFATPTILFHQYVGVDELAYRVLEVNYGPRAKRFEAVQDVTHEVVDFFLRQAERGFGGAARVAMLQALSSERPAEQIAAVKHRISNRLLLTLMRDRHEAYEACDEFLADHLESRYIPAVLFIQARALDTRLDELRFVRDKTQRELYTDFPHVQSESVWLSLLSEYPNSPLAIAAGLRVAQLRLRRGDAAGALDALERCTVVLDSPGAPATQMSESPLLQPQTPEVSLGFDPEPYRFEARRLHELIQANLHEVDETPRGIEPLRALARLDPHRPEYRDQLRRLAHRFQDARLYPNLVVRWATSHPEPSERTRLLRACVAAFPDDDALPEALFQLGDLEAVGGATPEARAAGRATLRRLVEDYPDTCWAELAAKRLRMLAPPVPPTTNPTEVS